MHLKWCMMPFKFTIFIPRAGVDGGTSAAVPYHHLLWKMQTCNVFFQGALSNPHFGFQPKLKTHFYVLSDVHCLLVNHRCLARGSCPWLQKTAAKAFTLSFLELKVTLQIFHILYFKLCISRCHFPSENYPSTDLSVNVFQLTFDFWICDG